MKRLTLGLVVLALAVGGSAFAGSRDGCPSISLKSCGDHPTRFADRVDPDDIRMAIRTEDGTADLILAGDVVALQFSDRTLRDIRRKLREKQDEDEDNALAYAIKSAVLSGVRSMLDHSVECPIRELRTVDYRNGRLILVTRDGDRIFENVEIDDQDVLECFSPRDARAFVAEFQRIKRRW